MKYENKVEEVQFDSRGAKIRNVFCIYFGTLNVSQIYRFLGGIIMGKWPFLVSNWS